MIAFSIKIRLGYLTLSASLFNQDVAARMHNSALQGLKEIPNLELVSDDKPLLEISASREAAKKLRREDVDAVLLNYAGWHYGDGTIAIAKELWETPLMLWSYGVNYGEWMIPLTGLMEATSSLQKIGKRFAIALGEPGEPVLGKIHSFLKAASVAKMIRSVNLGIVSYPCLGMLDTTPDPMALRRKLGTALVNLDITELLSIYEKIPEEEAKKNANDLLSGYGREVDQQNALKSVRMYLALREMVRKYDLRGFAVRCWPEMMVDHQVSPCLGISKLTSEGIMGVCEGDMHSTATMLILYELAGSLPCCLDFNTMDERENSVTLWHCGANAAELAEDSSKITLRYPLLSELMGKGGAALEFYMRPTRVTLAKLRMGYDKMLIASGETIKPRETSPRALKGGIAEVKLDSPTREFIEKACIEGFEHHVCVVPGDVKAELVDLCRILDIEPILI